MSLPSSASKPCDGDYVVVSFLPRVGIEHWFDRFVPLINLLSTSVFKGGGACSLDGGFFIDKSLLCFVTPSLGSDAPVTR